MKEKQQFFGMSKIFYLQKLANKYGNYKVAKAYTAPDGSLRWSKHRSIYDAWNDHYFLQQVNNRSGLETEIRLDIDQPTNTEAKAELERICTILEDNNIEYLAFFSGSKGYHIHMFCYELATRPSQKKSLKIALTKALECDLMKSSDNTMLTLEWSPNNKTGNQKIPVRGKLQWLA